MLLYLRLLNESFRFAISSLWNNKLRTILSLLGVTIGIFSIIAVLTAVDSLDRKIKEDLTGLDKNTMYVIRFSFGPTDIPSWKREQFPDVTYDEFEMLKRSVRGIDKISFNLFTRPENIKYEGNEASSVVIKPCTNEFEFIEGLKIEYGRFFNEAESNSGSQVILLGNEVATSLFESPEKALGKKIRVYGQKFNVIGVIKKQGFTTFGESSDGSAFLPMNFVRRRYGENSSMLTPAILIKPQPNADIPELEADIKQKLRQYRGLKYEDIDNFFINILSGFTDFIDSIIGNLNMMGWSIAFFSLLVGGFGISNIMFVSVKERTNLIGIQKSLGAKSRFILFQFLFEAIILALIGGLIGLGLVWILAKIMTSVLDFEFILGLNNVVLGSVVSIIIGLLSGIIPAYKAGKLDPVEAIRTGI